MNSKSEFKAETSLTDFLKHLDGFGATHVMYSGRNERGLVVLIAARGKKAEALMEFVDAYKEEEEEKVVEKAGEDTDEQVKKRSGGGDPFGSDEPKEG